MNAMHTREHERLLEAAIAGDVNGLDARLTERLRDCGECRARYEDLDAVRDLLDDAGHDERATLAGLDYGRTVPGSDRVAPFVHAMVARHGRERLQRRRRALAWAASAAAGIVALGWLMRGRLPHPVEHGPSVLLGGEQHAALSMSTADGKTTFTWDLAVPPGGRYELRIWDASASASSSPFVVRDDLRAAQWAATQEDTREWPKQIRWQVRVYDATDVQVGSAETTTELAAR